MINTRRKLHTQAFKWKILIITIIIIMNIYKKKMNRVLLRFVLCGIKLLYRQICKVYSGLMNGNKNIHIYEEPCAAFEEL